MGLRVRDPSTPAQELSGRAKGTLGFFCRAWLDFETLNPEFGVWGEGAQGFRVKVFRRWSGVGFRVQGSGFRVQGSGRVVACGLQGFGAYGAFWLSGTLN